MNLRSTSFFKKVLTLVIALALIVPAGVSFSPRPAYALFGIGDITFDPTNLVQNIFSAVKSSALVTKEYVLDTLAYQVAEVARQSVIRSLVNWINSGFQGSPAFVTDLKRNLRGVEDAVAQRFFASLASQDITDSDAQDRVISLARIGYFLTTSRESFYERYPNTLTQVSPDANAFLEGDFSQGGFDAWFSAVLVPQNNPYGMQELINQDLQRLTSEARDSRLQELSWNRGFVSWRGECIDQNPQGEQEYLPGDDLPADLSVDLTGEDACAEFEIETPGSVIVEQLNKTLGSNIDKLVSADEMNEIIGALLNQLVGHVLGTNGGGFRSASRPSSGGGSSIVDQATNPNQAGGSGATIRQNFITTVAEQKRYITDFQTAWTKIRTAADTALTRCGASGTPNPEDVAKRATTMLTKAANALTELEDISEDIAAIDTTAGDPTSALLDLTTRYQALLASGTLPTPDEIAEAQAESQDTGDTEPGSLYSQLTNRAASCTSGGN